MAESRTAQQIWETALGELQIQVNKPNYETWLRRTVGLSCQDKQFLVGVPNTFVAEYLDRNQRSLIEKVLTGILQQEVRIEFRVDSSRQDTPEASHAGMQTSSPQQARLPLFNPKYTFDSFVTGGCNQLAYAAALTIAQNPGHAYNPLFIYGGAGLGKTHLLQAIGHSALANNKKVLYISAEQYTNELMTAIREKTTKEFCSKYRGVDMLLVDDVQFFSGKTQTGEHFFHTFDELHNADHQIAITSDRPPKSIPLLPDRLLSRFEWGLVTNIQPPDFETRLAILQTKAKQIKANICPDVLELIARQIQQNIRALEGSLNRVIAYAKLVRTMVTPELATQALKDIGSSDTKTPLLTSGRIIEIVATSFQLDPSVLVGQRRDRESTSARRVAMYVMRQETNFSLAQIGKELGGRDAAAVTNACKKTAVDIDSSPYLRRKILEIQQTLHPSKGSA